MNASRGSVRRWWGGREVGGSGAWKAAAMAGLSVIVAAVVALSLAACDARTKGVESGKLRVVATTGMVADLAKRVGGDRVDVRALMGPGVDPHLYRPTPGDLRVLEAADVVLYNGLLLEGRMVEVLGRLGAKKSVVAVAEGLGHSEPGAGGGGGAGGAGDHHLDPHVWFDVARWSRALDRVTKALMARDPAGRDEYERRAREYAGELAELDAWCRSELAAVPEARRVLITAHDAFGYFGRAYGVEVHGLQGVSTDSEASLAEVRRLVELIAARGVRAVFVESSVPRKTIEALVEGAAARGHTVRIGGELFSDAMGPEGTPEGTYPGMVRHNVRTIVEALR